MEIYKHYEEIYEIKNFITDEENNKIFSFVDLSDDRWWKYLHTGNVLNIFKSDEDENNFKLLSTTITNKINSYFINQTHCNGFQDIRRLKKDEYFPSHEDIDPDLTKDKIMFGLVLFLNDDFEGGELYYTNLNLKIKPIKNSLLIHKATYAHEVLPVIQGNRYSLATFIRGNDNTKVLIK